MYVDEIRVQLAENRPQKQVQERLREYIDMFARNLSVHCMSGKLVNQKTPLGIYSQETEGLFFRGTTLFHDLHALIGYEFSHILPG